MMHGILNIYKEKGYTSHDVVAKLRGITGQRKIGHTGTLDPDAEGVLPVCLGRATKLCGLLTDKDKCYETVLLLGKTTDTQDISGNVLRTGDTSLLSEEKVRQVIQGFIGTYDQVPPMYSAVKVNGRKLYELAREGKVVERKPRRVEIRRIDITDVCLPRVRMRVHCSKGTYIRTLCHDIGERLGCGACMEELTRTRSGSFKIEDSLRLMEVGELKERGELEGAVLPMDSVFAEYRRGVIAENWQKPAYNGSPLPEGAVSLGAADEEREAASLGAADAESGTVSLGAADAESGTARPGAAPEEDESVRLYDTKGDFVGLYRYEGESGEYRIIKMFYLGERG